MRIPRRIAEFATQKQKFIDKQRDRLIDSVVEIQSRLLTAILSEIVPELDQKNGIVLETEKNYQLISRLDKLYKDFEKQTSATVLKEVNNTFSNIRSKDYDFLTIPLGGDLPEKFREIAKEAAEITDLRFGLKGGKFVRGGYLETLLKEMNSLSLKRLLSKMVTSQVNMSAFIKYISSYFKSREGFETKFRWFAFDLYQQYDATYNSRLADKLNLTNFIYQGGLIDDSRDFCACHDGKVWNIEDTKKWATWRPSDCDGYPKGYVQKQKNDEIPSYLGYPGYDPLIDRGGYNCRHQLNYITDELAEILRKEK